MSRMGTSCPLCQSSDLVAVLRLAATPVHQNVLAPTLAAATGCPRGPVDLTLCRACGFVFNASFDESLLRYSTDYENSQAHSATFRRYLDGIVGSLTSRHALGGKTIVEIGCGKGEFLTRLCAAAGSRGVGFDPSYLAGRDQVPPEVTIVPELYTAAHRCSVGDLVCSRHVIEHLPRPAELLRAVREAQGERPAVLFLETPRLEWILEQGAFWDIFYEHCSYFAMPVLRRLVERSGFAVTLSCEAFDGQYQWLEARPGRPRDGSGDSFDLVAWEAGLRGFGERWAAQQAHWRRQLEALSARGPCAIWGAGAKGVTFLNMLDVNVDTVPVVVDINPRKQGWHVPGTGQPVVAPAALRQHAVRTVLVMNPNYVSEVRAAVDGEDLGVEVVAVR